MHVLTIAAGVALGIIASAGLLYAATLWGWQVQQIASRWGRWVWLHKVRIIAVASASAVLVVGALLVDDERRRREWAAENQRHYEINEQRRMVARAKYCSGILATTPRPITVDKTNLMYSVLAETEREIEQQRKDCRSETQR